MNAYLEKVLNDVRTKHAGEPEFVQTVEEVYESIRPVVERNEEEVFFRVKADGFLYNMVRIMVGTLLEISEGKIEKGALPEIIDSLDRNRAGRTAPAHGLYLNKVFYGE